MENLTQVGSTACIILEHKATRGKRYEILLTQPHDDFGVTGFYDLVFKTRGEITGKSTGYPSKEAAYAAWAKNINTARCVDGINYLTIKVDS